MSHRYASFDPFSDGFNLLQDTSPVPLDWAPSNHQVLAPDQIELFAISPDVSYSTHALATAVPSRPKTSAQRNVTLDHAGQGVVSFVVNVLPDDYAQITFELSSGDSDQPILILSISQSSYKLSAVPDDNYLGPESPLAIAKEKKGREAIYLVPGTAKTHWLSIDGKNGILRYGRGYLSVSLTLLEAAIKTEVGIKDEGLSILGEKPHEWLKGVRTVRITRDGRDKSDLTVAKSPVALVTDKSPYVANKNDVTLLDLEAGFFTVPKSLPEVCQDLYYNIAGHNISLATEDFPDFAAAIERSVNTKGLLGHRILNEKYNRAIFGKRDYNGQYLRITLGPDMGNSPGIPYVLEIWPAGHYSPIHDHGNSHAIIKVLHGEINSYYFDSLEDRRLLRQPCKFKKNDITWMSDNLYQVHQLKNESKNGTVCVTIQCYKFGTDDKEHKEHFTYFKSPEEKYGEFVPTSDMAFFDFYTAIKKEWDSKVPDGPDDAT